MVKYYAKKEFIVLRGLPSSGKSTLAKKYKDQHRDSCFVCTTDDYWMRPDGTYDFNYDLLGRAHKWNLDRTVKIFKQEMNSEWNSIVILDNVNSRWHDFNDYVREAFNYGFNVKIEEPDTSWKFDVEECFKRSRDTGRKVPYSTILRMYTEWEPMEEILENIKEYEKIYK